MRAERLDAETKGKVLNAMRHIRGLMRRGLSQAEVVISQYDLEDLPEVKIQMQANSQDTVQQAADYLRVDFKREFKPELGWLEYSATTPEGIPFCIYAVHHAPGCEIVTETVDVNIPQQEAVPAHMESQNSLKLVCQGSPATIIPQPTTAPEGGESTT